MEFLESVWDAFSSSSTVAKVAFLLVVTFIVGFVLKLWLKVIGSAIVAAAGYGIAIALGASQNTATFVAVLVGILGFVGAMKTAGGGSS